MRCVRLPGRDVRMEERGATVAFDNGDTARLRPSYAALLARLADAPGEPVPTDTLLRWRHPDWETLSAEERRRARSAFHTAIRQLRAALRDEDGEIVVKTGERQSRGYQLVALPVREGEEPPERAAPVLTRGQTRPIQKLLNDGGLLWVVGPPGSGRRQAVLRALGEDAQHAIWVAGDREELSELQDRVVVVRDPQAVSRWVDAARAVVGLGWCAPRGASMVPMNPAEEDDARAYLGAAPRSFVHDDMTELVWSTGGLPGLLTRARFLLQVSGLRATQLVENADLVFELPDSDSLLTVGDTAGLARHEAWASHLDATGVVRDAASWQVLSRLRWLAAGAVDYGLLADATEQTVQELLPVLSRLASMGVLRLRDDRVLGHQDLIHALHVADPTRDGCREAQEAVLQALRTTPHTSSSAIALAPHVRKLATRRLREDSDCPVGLEALVWRIGFLRIWRYEGQLGPVIDDAVVRLRRLVDMEQDRSRELLARALIESGCVPRSGVDAPSSEVADEAVQLLVGRAVDPLLLADAHAAASLRHHVRHEIREARAQAEAAVLVMRAQPDVPRGKAAGYLLELANLQMVERDLGLAEQSVNEALLAFRQDEAEASGLARNRLRRRLAYGLVGYGNVMYTAERLQEAQPYYTEALDALEELERAERQPVYVAALKNCAHVEAMRGVANPATVRRLTAECAELEALVETRPRAKVQLASMFDVLSQAEELLRTGSGLQTHRQARQTALECARLGLEGAVSVARQIDAQAERFGLRTAADGEEDAFAEWLRSIDEDDDPGPPVEETMD